jgi:hypothetical protein
VGAVPDLARLVIVLGENRAVRAHGQDVSEQAAYLVDPLEVAVARTVQLVADLRRSAAA